MSSRCRTADPMNSADVHQILIPYLFAGGATGLILLIAVTLLKRDGAKQKEQARRNQEQA